MAAMAGQKLYILDKVINSLQAWHDVLAYDFAKINEETGHEPRSPKPIKKIFVSNGDKIQIDETTIDEYGGLTWPETAELQNWLKMPLNVEQRLKLPFRQTGSNSPKAYVIFYCKFSNIKEPIIEINFGKFQNNKGEFSASYNLKNNTHDITANGSVTIRLEKEKYVVGKSLLYDLYIKEKILDDNSSLDSFLFKKICQKFIDYVLEQRDPKELETFKPTKKSILFELYIVPTDKPVSYVYEQKKNDSFIDAFGRKSTGWPSTTTIDGKFLSFNDSSFSINCQKKESFYENLGIGYKSLDFINFPRYFGFWKSGLNWILSDMNNNENITSRHAGFYDAILKNHQTLKTKYVDKEKKSNLMIVCYKSQKAQAEILINENLTLDQLSQILKYQKPMPNLFEILIEENGDSVLFRNYLYFIQSFLNGICPPKEFFIASFISRIHKDLFSVINDRDKQISEKQFSDNIYKMWILYTKIVGIMVTEEEQYAQNIGKIAREFISFKKDVNESHNSLKDILTYSKYDREKLQHVLCKICRSLGLSSHDTTKIEKFISETIDDSYEIDDDKMYDDYSYFFYKGYFAGERN